MAESLCASRTLGLRESTSPTRMGGFHDRSNEVPILMKNQRGATIVEAALVLPVLFLLLLAIFEFGLVYSTYQTMTGAVREGARYAAATNANLGTPSAAQVAQVVCNYIQT